MFSWIDQRLVRERPIGRCTSDALALHLSLVAVTNAVRLSFYGDGTIVKLLGWSMINASIRSRSR